MNELLKLIGGRKVKFKLWCWNKHFTYNIFKNLRLNTKLGLTNSINAGFGNFRIKPVDGVTSQCTHKGIVRPEIKFIVVDVSPFQRHN